MADMPVLVCTAGALAGTVIRVPEGGLTLGRADDNDLVLPDDGASRYHAQFLYDNGSLWLRDAGSRNGVFVGEQRVTDHKDLRVGDIIQVADHVFEVNWAEDVDPRQPTDEAGEPAEGEAGRRPWFWPFGR